MISCLFIYLFDPFFLLQMYRANILPAAHWRLRTKWNFETLGQSTPSPDSQSQTGNDLVGIKFGEVERDCLLAHGASANLHECLFTLSNSYQMHSYGKCKNVANVVQWMVGSGRQVRGPYCRVCGSADDIVKADVPYGARLLCQELFSTGISLKFDTQLCWVFKVVSVE